MLLGRSRLRQGIGCSTELTSWTMLLATGIKFIMTATNVEMVMRYASLWTISWTLSESRF